MASRRAWVPTSPWRAPPLPGVVTRREERVATLRSRSSAAISDAGLPPRRPQFSRGTSWRMILVWSRGMPMRRLEASTVRETQQITPRRARVCARMQRAWRAAARRRGGDRGRLRHVRAARGRHRLVLGKQRVRRGAGCWRISGTALRRRRLAVPYLSRSSAGARGRDARRGGRRDYCAIRADASLWCWGWPDAMPGRYDLAEGGAGVVGRPVRIAWREWG